MTLRAESPPIGFSQIDSLPESTRYRFLSDTRRSYFSRRDPKQKEQGVGYVVDGGIEIRSAEGTVLGSVVRLNAKRVWFEPVKDSQTPYGRTIAIRLAAAYGEIGPVSAKIGIEPVDGELYAAAHLDELSLEDGRRIIDFMLAAAERGVARPSPPKTSVLTDIDDPVRIGVVAGALARRHADGILRNGDVASHATIRDYDEEAGVLTWKLTDSTKGEQFTAAGLRAEVLGYNSVYLLTFQTGEGSGDVVHTKLPVSVRYVRNRRYRRTTLSTRAFVRFKHPIWSEIPEFSCPLLDISFGGMAFPADPKRDALYVGLRIEGIEVVCGRDKTIALNGVVRTLTRSSTGEGTCGLSIDPPSPQDASLWADFVMQSLNQTTAPVEEKVEQLWQLYTDSGYFNLSGKEPEEFVTLSRAFRNVIDRSKATPWLTYQSVWPTRTGSIDASISLLKLYTGTWLMHQVAKRRGASHRDGQVRHVLRDTYLRAYEYAQADSNCRWVASYVEAQVPWTWRSHLAFTRQFGPTGGCVSYPFELFEISCYDRPELTPLGVFRVGSATEEECELLCDVLKEERPQAYLEAFDLIPERLGLHECKRAWQAAKFEREREILVARRRDSTPAAVAILEAGETGTNLFRITDSLRLVSLEPRGEAAFVELIEKARAWFRTRGKESFVYFSECEEGHRARATMARDLGPGRAWAIRSELIPDFLELVCELSVQRLGLSQSDIDFRSGP